jgi:hypothetical protein
VDGYIDGVALGIGDTVGVNDMVGTAEGAIEIDG